MADEKWIEKRMGKLLIRFFVQPRASKNEIVGLHGDALKVRLTSPPVEGAANAMLIKFLSKQLGIAKSSVSIHSGLSSRQKTVEVEGLTLDAALERLTV